MGPLHPGDLISPKSSSIIKMKSRNERSTSKLVIKSLNFQVMKCHTSIMTACSSWDAFLRFVWKKVLESMGLLSSVFFQTNLKNLSNIIFAVIFHVVSLLS